MAQVAARAECPPPPPPFLRPAGKGPIDGLAAHLADPWHTTFADNGVSVPELFGKLPF
jgi:hypothetical protein